MAARSCGRAAFLALLLPAASAAGLAHGDAVFFTVPRTEHRLTVEENGHVQAFWSQQAAWQRFTVELEDGAGEVVAGSAVYLKAWTGQYLKAQGKELTAASSAPRQREQFKIALADGGSGAIAPGSRVILRTWSGKAVVVDDPESPGVVSIGTSHEVATQALVVEMAPQLSTTQDAATTRLPTTTEAQVVTTGAPSTTAKPTTTKLEPTSTTPEPTTTAEQTSKSPTTTAAAPTTTTGETTTAPTTPAPTTKAPTTPATTTLAPTTAPTTTTPAPTTPAPTTAQPRTTEAAVQGPACESLDAAGIAAALSVKTVRLPAAMRRTCPGFSIDMSCRHGLYAATPHNGGAHALFYNDAAGNAIVVLFDGDNEVVRSKVIGTEKARGLQFEPSGAHLVALISGRTNTWMVPQVFVKMEVPSLAVVWAKPIESPLIGLEKWTPDNTDSIAVSDHRYVLHSAGVCRDGKWCQGHQGDITQVLNATTGEQIASEGKDWVASHSCKQMVAYSAASDTFLIANAGDYYPKELLFTGFAGGRHLDAKASFPGWGNGGGLQGVSQGAIRADPWSGGFASVWSYGTEGGGPDKLYFATISEDVEFVQEPTPIFPDSPGMEVSGSVAPLGPDRWLVAYNEAPTDVLDDYLRIYFEDWGLPASLRSTGARLAIVDSTGRPVGDPVDVAALGAPLPVEINHLVQRRDGLGWIFLDGPGMDTAKIVHLKCRPAAPHIA